MDEGVEAGELVGWLVGTEREIDRGREAGREGLGRRLVQE